MSTSLPTPTPVQYLRGHRQGQALDRLQGKEKEDHHLLCHQECREIPKATRAARGAHHARPRPPKHSEILRMVRDYESFVAHPGVPIGRGPDVPLEAGQPTAGELDP